MRSSLQVLFVTLAPLQRLFSEARKLALYEACLKHRKASEPECAAASHFCIGVPRAWVFSGNCCMTSSKRKYIYHTLSLP